MIILKPHRRYRLGTRSHNPSAEACHDAQQSLWR